jgi:hypothetical protein
MQIVNNLFRSIFYYAFLEKCWCHIRYFLKSRIKSGFGIVTYCVSDRLKSEVIVGGDQFAGFMDPVFIDIRGKAFTQVIIEQLRQLVRRNIDLPGQVV